MNNIDKKYKELLDAAKLARGRSYCPYSGFAVGAALLTASGKVYLGANIENAAYSVTICAERVAMSKAISEGDFDFVAIAIAGGKKEGDASSPCPPCGSCRQFMSEFTTDGFKVILAGTDEPQIYTLGELLPKGFDKGNL